MSGGNLKRRRTLLDGFIGSKARADDFSPLKVSNGPLSSFVRCPICNGLIHAMAINSHLDKCAVEDKPQHRSAMHDFKWSDVIDDSPLNHADARVLSYVPQDAERPSFLKSFEAMASCALELYPSQCSVEARAWESFEMLSHQAKMLYARLFRRKNATESRRFLLDDAMMQSAIRDGIVAEDSSEEQLVEVAEELTKSNLARTTTTIMEAPELVNLAHGLLSSLRLDQLTTLLCLSLPKSRAEAQRMGRESNLKVLSECLVPKGGLNFCALKRRVVTATQVRLARRVIAEVGPCLQLESESAKAFKRLSLIFHLGHTPDEAPSFLFAAGLPYATNAKFCRVSGDLFPSREAVIFFEQAKEKEIELQQLSERQNTTAILAIAELAANQLSDGRTSQFGFDYQTVWAGILWHSISSWEKSGKHDRAVEFLLLLLSKPFTPRRRGKWYNRLTIDLDHLGRRSEAVEHCILGLSESERKLGMRRGDRFQLAKRALRLSKHSEDRDETHRIVMLLLGNDDLTAELPTCSLVGRPMDEYRAAGGQSVFYGYDGEKVSVEELCIQYYAKDGWKGQHCEGSRLRHLFFLLCYDIIFADIVDAFQVPFQILPTDLGTLHFLPKRKRLLQPFLEKLKKASRNEISERTISALVEHGGNIGLLEPLGRAPATEEEAKNDELVEIAHAIGGPCLAAVFLLFSLDFSYYGSGLPDLLLWRLLPTPAALFVEVKGPRDSLSERQRAWLHEFLSVNPECAELCRVLEPDQAKNGVVEVN